MDIMHMSIDMPSSVSPTQHGSHRRFTYPFLTKSYMGQPQLDIFLKEKKYSGVFYPC